jgi:hypothetical protein
MVLNGQKLVQVWQWAPSAQSERTVADVVKRCKDFAFTGTLVKALDGVDWMGKFDPTPAALRSVDDARRQANEAHAAGLLYAVWTNPLDRDLAQQAQMTAALARAPEIDAVFLDAEPYPKFWGAMRPVGRAREFMQRVRDGAPDAYLVLQPDPRQARLNELRPEEWIPFIDALSGQHYFSDFQVDPVSEVERAVALGLQVDRPIYPTLPGNAPPAQLTTAVKELIKREVGGCVMFRLGTCDGPRLKAIGSAEFPKVRSLANRLIHEGADGGRARISEAEALRHLQSRGHAVPPSFAIGRAAIGAYQLGLPYTDPGPAVEPEREEVVDGKRWAVQRFANMTFKWSSETGVLLKEVNQ